MHSNNIVAAFAPLIIAAIAYIVLRMKGGEGSTIKMQAAPLTTRKGKQDRLFYAGVLVFIIGGWALVLAGLRSSVKGLITFVFIFLIGIIVVLLRNINIKGRK